MIIGEVFIKTKIIITGMVAEKETTIKALLNTFKKTAKDRGITNIWVNPNIIEGFGNEKVSDTSVGPSRLFRFVSDSTNGNIIDTCKQLHVYQKCDLGDAITRATQLVALGELDLKNKHGVCIHVTNKRDCSVYELWVWRDYGGLLNLDLIKMFLDSKCLTSRGILVSNENFKG